jgi:hypothetical protein
MTKSNLIETLKTFTQKEIRDFSEFIISPYFNKNENVIKLFEILKKSYPDFEAEKIDKEKIFKKLFPGKPYKDSTIRLLMFYLLETVERFLAINRFSKDEFRFKEALAKEFNERGLLKDYEKVVSKHKDYLSKVIYKDDDYFMNCFIYQEENLNYLSAIFENKYEKFLTKENLESVTNNLTYYYLLRVFKFYAVSLNTMSLYSIQIDTTLFDNLLKHFSEESFKEIPIIDIYYHIILSFTEPDIENHFFRVKQLITDNDSTIDREAQIDIFINLENYCHRKFRSGSNKFLREAFDVYKLELERGLHIERGYMSSQFYTSAVVTGCRLKEYDWVRNFIEEYKKELKKDTREAMYYFGMSFLENDLQNYEKALEYLAKSKAEELYLKMDIRLLQSRIYYSLVWNLPLQSLLDTFKRTVQNNKHMKENRKQQYLIFIRYLNHMNNLRYKEDKKGIGELKYELEKEDYFPHKIWLQDEVTKLEAAL